MDTENECSIVGNDPNDPGDVRYGPGTWDWDGNITDRVSCEVWRAEKAGNSDGDRGSDEVGCSEFGGICQPYSNCKEYKEDAAPSNGQSCGEGQRCCIPKPACTAGTCRNNCESGERRDNTLGCPNEGKKCCISNT